MAAVDRRGGEGAGQRTQMPAGLKGGSMSTESCQSSKCGRRHPGPAANSTPAVAAATYPASARPTAPAPPPSAARWLKAEPGPDDGPRPAPTSRPSLDRYIARWSIEHSQHLSRRRHLIRRKMMVPDTTHRRRSLSNVRAGHRFSGTRSRINVSTNPERADWATSRCRVLHQSQDDDAFAVVDDGVHDQAGAGRRRWWSTGRCARP